MSSIELPVKSMAFTAISIKNIIIIQAKGMDGLRKAGVTCSWECEHVLMGSRSPSGELVCREEEGEELTALNFLILGNKG